MDGEQERVLWRWRRWVAALEEERCIKATVSAGGGSGGERQLYVETRGLLAENPPQGVVV